MDQTTLFGAKLHNYLCISGSEKHALQHQEEKTLR